jgi:hypothetical protein
MASTGVVRDGVSWVLAQLSKATVLLQLLAPVASLLLAPVRGATLRLVDSRWWIADL